MDDGARVIRFRLKKRVTSGKAELSKSGLKEDSSWDGSSRERSKEKQCMCKGREICI